ncbi:hypothetical protein [Rhodopseudomonas sp. B29]|uniref:hypothetical protein n=1 Tax=Rhodopseudomonas sp. B29 TaxID=95607 RepID=UPI00034AC2A4|nr:hypothetical protein [Rhodopseudomonas sp. B29]
MTALPFRLAGFAALMVAALMLNGSPTLAQQGDHADKPPARPRLADIMQGVQWRHMKLWFAAKAHNWELAGYETKQIRARLEDAASLYQSLPVSDLTTMAKPLDAVAAAIAAKDYAAFTKAYAGLTTGCNGCHDSVKLGFVVIKTPTSDPFADQDFRLPKK